MADLIARLRAAVEGRYRVERELGHGGMAVVFLADDLRHHRRVAIKVLQPALGEAGGPERFLREIAALATLTHPHILPLHDSGEHDGLLYFVMPFVEGVSLRHRLQQEGRLPVAEALRITREVADALGHAHAKGFVHRDIKPENILFQSGHALLADFGIARALQAAGGERLTDTGLAIGTFLYMSPEQATGSGQVDARSDVYSLGCTLAEMLTGQAPFGGMPDSLRRPSSLVPAPVVALLDRMLQRDPDGRFTTGEALLGAIDAALQAVTAAAAPPAWRRRVPAGAAVLVLLAIAVAFLVYRVRGPAIQSVAVLPPRDLTGDSARRHLVDGIHEALIGELAGVHRLRVISRTSSARYAGVARAIPEIARELHVDAIIETTVSAEGSRITLRAHAIQATGAERDLGAEAFTRDLRDVLALYRDATSALVRRMGIPLDSAEQARLTAARQVDPEAYDRYLRGMYVLHHAGTPSEFSRGLGLLQEAIARDSTEPLPWAGMALAYDQIGHTSGQVPDAFARARAAAERARQLGGALPEADAALAQTRLYDDWQRGPADSLFLRAIRANPSLPDALSHFGWSLLLAGRFDSAVAMLRRAEEVDPLTALWPAFTASAASWIGRMDLARPAIRRALALDPELPIAQYIFGTILALDRRFPEAIAAERRAVAGNRIWRFGLGYVLARAGLEAEARTIAAEIGDSPSGIEAWGLAEIHATLGEKAEALRWLDAARIARWNWMPWMDFNPAFAPLRNEPGFATILAAAGAPRCGACDRRPNP